MTAPPATSSEPVLTVERRPSPAPTGRGWILAILPAFPLVMLVLRVWYLGRQDPQTILLVLQYANPLGLISALLISLIWAAPAAVLAFRALYLLLLVSGAGNSRSWLARAGARTPGWVAVPAVMLAALSWQMRFLPTLVMLGVVISGLQIRSRPGSSPPMVALYAVVIPASAGLLTLVWVMPAVWQALTVGEPATAALLAVPPLVGPFLTGPVPAVIARWLLPTVAAVLAISAPLLLGSRYLHAPVLPRVAVELRAPDDGVRVMVGDLVAVDDRFTAILDRAGMVHFLPGGQVRSQVLCSSGAMPPLSEVAVHGWHTELSMLAWAAPRRLTASVDPRCPQENETTETR